MTGELIMRRAALSDVTAILALLADDDLKKLQPVGPAPGHHAAFAAIDQDANQLLAVALLHNEIIGCLQITFIPGLSRDGMWRAVIEMVRVKRQLRGQGFGREMMAWALAQARNKGVGMVQLLADAQRHEAHRFYQSIGFKASHQGFRLYF